MVTALIDRSVRLAGLEAGAEDFLEKPVDRAELWLRVRNLLRLKSLADLLHDHSQVLEQEVAARTADLNASELRFRQMAENIRDVFFLREATGDRVVYVSRAYEEIWGRSCESLYANPDSWDEATHPDDRVAVEEKRRSGMLSGRYEVEYRIIRPEGAIRWIESRVFPVYDEANRIVRFAGIAKDVTERREAQDRIAYLNRVYAVLSGINALIVRARDRDELFKEACRIAVAGGGFRLSLIALVDPHSMKP
ncbi:MAG: PAS domain-containing protein, partial [Vicinamibacteria bacterium]|nr:PAS domain-containing protein [Vicinamibacteria bacterium]